MFQMILSLYIKSLVLSALIVGVLCSLWLGGRRLGKIDKTQQERQLVLYELAMVMIVSVPILAFGLVAIFIMLQV